MFSQGLPAVGAGGFVGAVWVEDDLPAPAVDAGFVVKLAEQPAVLDAGRATVFFVRQVVDVAGGGRAVAAAGPCAVLVAQDDGTADVGRDRV